MKLWFKYASIILRSQMQYKTSFLLTSIGQFLISFSGFLAIYFMFSRFNNVSGFSVSEVLICYSSMTVSFYIAECFFRGFDVFRGVISNGEFDRIMVRPRNEILQVLGARIDYSRIARLLQGTIILIYAVNTCGVDWQIDKITTLIFMILGGTFLFAGLFIIYASICFYTIEGLEVMNIFTEGGRELGSYPLSIYGTGILKFFTYVIPISLVQYYPLMYLLGKTNNILYIFLPLAGILFILICFEFWKIGIRHYKSTGS